MILVTPSNWINCSFSRPSKVRISFCQIAAKFFFFKFKICQTVARHKYDKSISQKIICCLSLTNHLISKLRLPYIGFISAIVHWQNIPNILGNWHKISIPHYRGYPNYRGNEWNYALSIPHMWWIEIANSPCVENWKYAKISDAI